MGFIGGDRLERNLLKAHCSCMAMQGIATEHLHTLITRQVRYDIHRIFELTNGRGVLVADRGFDAGVMFEDWLENRYRFITRLVGNRHLLRFCGDSGQSQAARFSHYTSRLGKGSSTYKRRAAYHGGLSPCGM